MMEPHSRPGSSHNGTLRLPQALVLLLRTTLAGPTSDPVTQTADPALRQNIKNSAYRLVSLFNPFVVSDNLHSSTFVGMVKLAALCGIGSVFWLWSKQKRKAKVASSPEPPQKHAEAVGKKVPRSATWLRSCGPPESDRQCIEHVTNR
jgi:hypothetical protein